VPLYNTWRNTGNNIQRRCRFFRGEKISQQCDQCNTEHMVRTLLFFYLFMMRIFKTVSSSPLFPQVVPLTNTSKWLSCCLLGKKYGLLLEKKVNEVNFRGQPLKRNIITSWTLDIYIWISVINLRRIPRLWWEPVTLDDQRPHQSQTLTPARGMLGLYTRWVVTLSLVHAYIKVVNCK
jgi:hypothetical protein